MSLSPRHLNGYYNDHGAWQQTKHCFIDCGHFCNCRPPGNLYYSAAHDKRLQKPEEKKDDDDIKGI